MRMGWLVVVMTLAGCGPGLGGGGGNDGGGDATQGAPTGGASMSAGMTRGDDDDENEEDDQDDDDDDPTPTTGGADGTTGGPPMTACEPAPPRPGDCGDAVLEDAWVHIGTEADDERSTLEGVRVIDGSLMIHRAPDENLDFLACIEEITGSLIVHDNDALVCMTGLAHVQRLGGDVVITRNDALQDIDALVGVEELERENEGFGSIEHSLIVLNNASLIRVSGLTELAIVHGAVHIRDNPMLQAIDGLVGLLAVGGSLAINHNESLCQSHIDELGEGIEQPAEIPSSWSSIGNAEGC